MLTFSGAAGKVRDLVRRGDSQPKLPSKVAARDRQQDMRLSRSEGIAQHGSGRPYELKHAPGQCLEPCVIVERVPRPRPGQVHGNLFEHASLG